MSLSDIASLASIISGAAVLVSLVYLGVQTRQNARHTMALIGQGRAQQITDRMAALAADPVLLDVSTRGRLGDQSLSDAEVMRFYLVSTATLHNFEDQYFHQRDGISDGSRYTSFLRSVESMARNPGWRAFWTLSRARFDPGFIAFVDNIVATERAAPSPPDLPAAWRALVGEERAKQAI